MNHEIRIETTFNNDEIRQTMHGHGCVEDQIIQSVIKLKDEGVRKALIELGWTPPVAAPVPDYTGEGSAWTPPNLESRLVPVLDADSVHPLIAWTENHRVRMSETAENINKWLHDNSRSIPASRVLGEGIEEGTEVCAWDHGVPWTDSDERHYLTSCGQEFMFEDGTLEDNGFKFCHHCGKRVVDISPLRANHGGAAA